MAINFHKYTAAGNDFILIDDRDAMQRHQNEANNFYSKPNIEKYCDRRFGVGADGLIRLTTNKKQQLTMINYDADGGLSSFCGNGARCMIAFANKLGLKAQTNNAFEFIASDGLHTGKIINSLTQTTDWVDISLQNPHSIKAFPDGYYIDTGSPHFVSIHKNIHLIDLTTTGKNTRHDPRFAPQGCNANFLELINSTEGKVRTFERGVEAETLSCGTGAVASAITIALANQIHQKSQKIKISTPGCDLNHPLIVMFDCNDSKSTDKEPKKINFFNVHLQGPATFVYEGLIDY